ncbi:NOB1 [Sanghuangporus sanghuang]
MGSEPACKNLVLDAGPLLSLSPLRGLAERYLTVPQVVNELKDKNAREHFERLGLLAGVKIEVREPDAASFSQIIQFAKKTGDYSVLSHADLCVLALTLALDNQEKAQQEEKAAAGHPSDEAEHVQLVEPSDAQDAPEDSAEHELGPIPAEEQKDGSILTEDASQEVSLKKPPPSTSEDDQSEEDDAEREPLNVVLEPVADAINTSAFEVQKHANSYPHAKPTGSTPLFDDPSDEDDGEGEWITPDNVEVYKSHALELFPSSDRSDAFTTVSGKKRGGKGRRKQQGEMNIGSLEQIAVGCMTADFAMQNVLLQMNLNLVGIEGKRIDKVKSWVLRCHACFKICKDSSKRFCPSCGNPSLLRTSVTVKSSTADESSPALEVHLKKNFQYRTRGTKYSIPAPKFGSAKKGSGEGLILREDQTEYMRARKREEGRRQREEKRIVQQSLTAAKGGESTGIKLGNWMDPDWVPEMLSVGIGGKGRRALEGRAPVGPDGTPVIGYGRKNPNERRRKR